MSTAELRELNIDELQLKVAEARKELFELRFKHSLHQLENTAQLPKLKREVARLRTILNEKSRQQAK